jgi:DNA-binding NarL/FixJ family response regulator
MRSHHPVRTVNATRIADRTATMSTSATRCDRRRGGGLPEMDSGGGEQHVLLIVDDHAVMRALLRDFLRSSIAGLDVSEAPDGARALRLARERSPQVVLMDINLPDANGIELTAQIKALLPHTRVIIVTSLAGAADLERARAAGAFGYVTKDKIYAELVPLVARALSTPTSPESDGGAA